MRSAKGIPHLLDYLYTKRGMPEKRMHERSETIVSEVECYSPTKNTTEFQMKQPWRNLQERKTAKPMHLVQNHQIFPNAALPPL